MTEPNEYSQENQENIISEEGRQEQEIPSENQPAEDQNTEGQQIEEQNTEEQNAEAERPEANVYRTGRVYSPQAPEGTPFRIEPEAPFEMPPRQPPKRQNRHIGRTVLALLLVVLLAASSGFAGAWLYGHGGTQTEGIVTRENVVYQSVIRTVGEGDDQEDGLSVSGVAEVAAPSVVEIVTEQVSYNAFFGQYPTSGAGSGVILSKEGLIVTNYHVIEDAQKVEVTLASGESFQAQVVGGDQEDDLAVLKIEPGDTELTPALLGSSDNIKVGESVVAIGNPLGELGGTVTDGIISALDREIEIDGQRLTLMQTNAAVNPGNSGGGLFNMYGELIGIVNAKITNSGSSGTEGLGFAIPIDHASPIIEELCTYGYVRGKIDTGMEFLEINDATTAMYYGVSKSGVYILSVEDSSLGFRSGDMIESIDGKEIVTMEQLEAIWEEHSVGDSLSVTVERRVARNAYEQYTYQLTLKEEIPDTLR